MDSHSRVLLFWWERYPFIIYILIASCPCMEEERGGGRIMAEKTRLEVLKDKAKNQELTEAEKAEVTELEKAEVEASA